MTPRPPPPILLAYLTPKSQFVIWCKYCKRWHWHINEEGHRVAHCDIETPYLHNGGYILKYAGPFTKEVLDAHKVRRPRGWVGVNPTYCGQGKRKRKPKVGEA